MEVQTTPEFDMALREAQAAYKEQRQQELEAERRAAEEKQQQANAQAAADLKQVMALLGCECDPVKGEIELGDYRFSLNSVEFYDGRAKRLPVGQPAEPIPAIRWDLSIKLLNTDESIYFNELGRSQGNCAIAGDWTKDRAKLAESMATLRDHYAQKVEDVELRAQQIAEYERQRAEEEAEESARPETSEPEAYTEPTPAPVEVERISQHTLRVDGYYIMLNRVQWVSFSTWGATFHFGGDNEEGSGQLYLESRVWEVVKPEYEKYLKEHN